MILGYDLGAYPITYDFVNWLVRVREKTNPGDAVGIIFQPGEHEGFRLKTVRDYQFTAERKQWRLENLLLPLAWRAGFESVSTVPQRLDILTPNFDIFKGIFKSAENPFEASPAAIAAVQAMYPERYVSITLRQSDVQIERNSDLAAWQQVVHWLVDRGYRVVIVPDTEAVLQNRAKSIWTDECVAASMNVDLRLALYENAQFCLFTSGGPMNLVQFDAKIRYLTLGLVCKGIKTCEPDHLTYVGLEDGATRGAHRMSLWAADSFANIVNAIDSHSDSYLDIDYQPSVQDAFKARTHFDGHPIVAK